MTDPNQIGRRYSEAYGIPEPPSVALDRIKSAAENLAPMEDYKAYSPDGIKRVAHEALETASGWETAEKDNLDTLQAKITDYKRWIDGAGATSKLGIFYRRELAKLTDKLADLMPSSEDEFKKRLMKYVEDASTYTSPWDLSAWTEENMERAIKTMNDLHVFESPVDSESK